MNYDFILQYKGNQFFPVREVEIEEAEESLGIIFPNELKKFLTEVGYGFLKGSEFHVNRMMGPASIRDARLKVNDFQFHPDIEVYEELEKDKMIFFEANESTLLLMEMGKEQNNAVYYDDIKIADSLLEFLMRMMEDDEYYIDFA